MKHKNWKFEQKYAETLITVKLGNGNPKNECFQVLVPLISLLLIFNY